MSLLWITVVVHDTYSQGGHMTHFCAMPDMDKQYPCYHDQLIVLIMLGDHDQSPQTVRVQPLDLTCLATSMINGSKQHWIYVYWYKKHVCSLLNPTINCINLPNNNKSHNYLCNQTESQEEGYQCVMDDCLM